MPEYLGLRCPICDSTKAKNLFTLPSAVPEIPSSFGIVRCIRCGHVFGAPPPDASLLSRFYNDPDYRKDIYDDVNQYNAYIHYEKLKDQFVKETSELMCDYGNLLDVGCGLAYFLDAIRGECDSVEGQEVSEFQANFAMRKFRLKVFRGPLTEAQYQSRYFNTVTCWEVVEHLINPVEYLIEMNRIMVEGGLLGISTRNFDGISSRLTKEKWRYLTPPEHLHFFTPKTLEFLCQRTGFQLIKIVTSGVDIYNILRALKDRSSFDRQATIEGKDMLKSTIDRTKHLRIFKALTLQAMSKCVSMLGIGDQIRIYARKIRRLEV